MKVKITETMLNRWRSGLYGASPDEVKALVAEVDAFRKANDRLEREAEANQRRLQKKIERVSSERDRLVVQTEFERVFDENRKVE